jgi:hypothetical protein
MISVTVQFRMSFFTSHIRNTKIKIYRTLILPIVLYGCERTSIAFENTTLGRLFELNVEAEKNCIGEAS